MKRNTAYIYRCLFLLLCIMLIPFSFRQYKNSPSPQQKHDTLPYHPIDYFNFAGEKGVLLKRGNNFFAQGDMKLDPTLPGKKNLGVSSKKEGIVEQALEAVEAEECSKAKKRDDLPSQCEVESAIHFLLIGRWWSNPAAKLLMVITLIPECSAHLTLVDPDIRVEGAENHCPIGSLLQRGDSPEKLYPAITTLTGLTPRFFIDLNLHGFVEMVDLLQKEAPSDVPSHSEKALPAKSSLGGYEVLRLLNDTGKSVSSREDLIMQMLLDACEIQFTPFGMKLLWMGYRNLKTDLSLRDLLEIRKVTQGISPAYISLREIGR